jgi:hypothetical protein
LNSTKQVWPHLELKFTILRQEPHTDYGLVHLKNKPKMKWFACSILVAQYQIWISIGLLTRRSNCFNNKWAFQIVLTRILKLKRTMKGWKDAPGSWYLKAKATKKIFSDWWWYGSLNPYGLYFMCFFFFFFFNQGYSLRYIVILPSSIHWIIRCKNSLGVERFWLQELINFMKSKKPLD